MADVAAIAMVAIDTEAVVTAMLPEIDLASAIKQASSSTQLIRVHVPVL